MRTNLDGFFAGMTPLNLRNRMDKFGSKFYVLLVGLLTTSAGYCQNIQATTTSTSSLPTNQTRAVLPKKNKSQLQKWDWTWNFDLKGSEVSSENSKSTGTDFHLKSHFMYRFLDELSFTIAPSLGYKTGYYQNMEPGEAKTTELTVTEAQATLEVPHSAGTTGFSLGALNESRYHTSLLLDDRAFPGVRMFEDLIFSSEDTVGLSAEASVPTATGMSAETRDFEKTPTFLSAQVHGQGKTYLLDWGLSAGYFEYQNLPTTISTKSGQSGNSVEKINAIDARFIYQYRGYEASAKGTFRLSSFFTYALSLEGVQNQGAPDQNRAYKIANDLSFSISRRWNLIPTYQYYLIQPDAAVSSYNSQNYETNRVGYKTGLMIERRKNFKISLLGGEQDVLFFSPSQVRETRFEIKMETLNEML